MPRSPGRNNRPAPDAPTLKEDGRELGANEMPHGGLKMSRYGKDLSMYALEDYTVPRHVMVKL